MTDWDAELKKIDKQLESISDPSLAPAPLPSTAASPAGRAAGGPARQAQVPLTGERSDTRSWPALLRLALAAALGVGILFWPYDRSCGPGLFGYLGAVAVLVAAGVWSSVWTWKHRTGRAHVLSVLLIIWGLVLGAVEVLPRAGYARTDVQHPLGFSCVAPGNIMRVPAPNGP